MVGKSDRFALREMVAKASQNSTTIPTWWLRSSMAKRKAYIEERKTERAKQRWRSRLSAGQPKLDASEKVKTRMQMARDTKEMKAKAMLKLKMLQTDRPYKDISTKALKINITSRSNVIKKLVRAKYGITGRHQMNDYAMLDDDKLRAYMFEAAYRYMEANGINSVYNPMSQKMKNHLYEQARKNMIAMKEDATSDEIVKKPAKKKIKFQRKGIKGFKTKERLNRLYVKVISDEKIVGAYDLKIGHMMKDRTDEPAIVVGMVQVGKEHRGKGVYLNMKEDIHKLGEKLNLPVLTKVAPIEKGINKNRLDKALEKQGYELYIKGIPLKIKDEKVVQNGTSTWYVKYPPNYKKKMTSEATTSDKNPKQKKKLKLPGANWRKEVNMPTTEQSATKVFEEEREFAYKKSGVEKMKHVQLSFIDSFRGENPPIADTSVNGWADGVGVVPHIRIKRNLSKHAVRHTIRHELGHALQLLRHKRWGGMENSIEELTNKIRENHEKAEETGDTDFYYKADKAFSERRKLQNSLEKDFHSTSWKNALDSLYRDEMPALEFLSLRVGTAKQRNDTIRELDKVGKLEEFLEIWNRVEDTNKTVIDRLKSKRRKPKK